jgi:hypothetical protein
LSLETTLANMKQSLFLAAVIAFSGVAGKCLPPVAHEGTPVGKEIKNDDSMETPSFGDV